MCLHLTSTTQDMARLGKHEQRAVKEAIQQYPEKTNTQIAEELGVSVHAVAGLRRGISRQNSHQEHGAKVNTRRRATRHSHKDMACLEEQRQQEGQECPSFDMSTLITCLKETAQLLVEKPDRVGTLLYRQKPIVEYCPRELEAQHTLSNVLSKYGYFHMIESPITDHGGQGFVDVTIYSQERTRLVDIELKENVTGADRDFPKLAMSSAVGASVFFIANQKNIEMVLSNTVSAYQDMYERVFREIPETQIRDKWFLFFLVACKEQRMYVAQYQSITHIDFSQVLTNRIQ